MEGYITFKLDGLSCVELENSKRQELQHSLFTSFKIEEQLENVTLYFNDHVEIDLRRVKAEAEFVIFDLLMKLILSLEVEVDRPSYKLSAIHSSAKSNLEVYDSIELKCELTVKRLFDSEDFLNSISVNQPLVKQTNHLLYKRLYYILRNDNQVTQYLMLYDFLMEVVSQNNRKEQRRVGDFLKERKIENISWHPTKRPGKTFQEDTFTYLRNEIAHAEFDNNFEEYEKVSNKVNGKLIQHLAQVVVKAINKYYS